MSIFYRFYCTLKEIGLEPQLLKFRIDKNSGALVLWYELQQIEAVIERACADIAATLQTAFADVPIYYGQP